MSGVVGKPAPLVDARAKVTGRGVYTDDVKLPGMLVGKILRSPLAYARILSIDTARAEALPGVRAVVTGRESEVRFGVLPVSRDETAMAVDRVRYIGDCVAGVAADDEEIALEAVRRIEVAYEPLEPVLTLDEALKPAAVPIHDRTLAGTNVQKAVDQSFGDVEAAFAASAFVERRQFRFAAVTHAFTEPHCVIAHWDHDGRLTVWSATQVPHYLHRALSEVTGMPMHLIRIIRPMVGGAFGGKSDPFPHEMIAALLSRRTRRPVKILFDREEVFLTHHGRHPTRTDMAMGVSSEGRLTGLDLKSLIDGGAWGSFGVVTTYYNGVLCMGPYRIDHFRYSGKRCYTNKPPSGAMRGHGAVNSRFAMEVLVDVLAEKAGLDPIEFRLRNLLPPMTTTINEFRITSNGTREALETVRQASEWDAQHGKLPYGEGIGVACGFYISGSALPIHWTKTPQSTVHVKIDSDGGVTVHSLAAEIGQGSDTMLAQCVAEPLGIPLGRVRVFSSDSDTAPIDLGSYSSRVTFMAGNAARRAAEEARKELVAAAAALTGYQPEGFVLRDEQVVYAPDPRIAVSFMDALQEAIKGRGALVARGCYAAAPPMGGKFKGAAAGLSPSYTFQAYVARVSVDPETGFVAVRKIWAAHDCGRALNPTAVIGQIQGCVHMGLGQALAEDFRYHRGNVLDANLLDYRTLTPKQMPPVDVFLIETHDPEGPFGAKEAGEGPILPVAPAVANALHDAVGVRMQELPMTPDRILSEILRGAPGPKARPPAPAGGAGSGRPLVPAGP
ncbi:MAG TPA: xanthine dehydrogenase family protein molybdopterin-binding subunit [Candidatus Polarisedimenticolia bacterium]|nr:xanthine dehydrogenase family protein molybdopterin-binding subunit [Candidatus Polarisedimenticolia bacterium]